MDYDARVFILLQTAPVVRTPNFDICGILHNFSNVAINKTRVWALHAYANNAKILDAATSLCSN